MERLNWKQFAKTVPQKTDIVLLPVGTIEAHGPGALGTDAVIPTYIANKLSHLLNALVAPTINYGVTKSLIAFPGSLTVTTNTLKEYVREVAFSLADAGFKKIIILNGHGGNTDSFDQLGIRLWKEKGAGSLVIHWWTATEKVALKYFDGTGHGAADELSALMAIDNTLLSKSDYQKEETGRRFDGIDMYPFYKSVILNCPGKGYPQFNLSKSKKYLAEVIVQLAKDIKQILSGWEKIF